MTHSNRREPARRRPGLAVALAAGVAGRIAAGRDALRRLAHGLAGLGRPDPDRLPLEGQAAGYLGRGWVIANHKLVSFNAAFISSVLSLPVAALAEHAAEGVGAPRRPYGRVSPSAARASRRHSAAPANSRSRLEGCAGCDTFVAPAPMPRLTAARRRAYNHCDTRCTAPSGTASGMCNPTECRYLSQATQLLATVDEAGAICSTGSRQSRALGYAAADLEGTPLSDLVAADDRAHLARLLDRTRHAPATWDRVTFRRADGRAEPLLCCFQRVRDGDRPPKTVLVVGLALESLGRQVRAEAAAALGHLAFACHSPAHRLMEALEVVLAECPASRAAQRCREDLDHLLEALSQASAWPKADGRPVDAVAVVESVLEMLDGDAGFARLGRDLRPETPAAWTRVHPAALAYVTLHLAANARDATAETASPRLRITVAADAGRVILEFQDNGPGLAPGDRDRAFAPCAAGPSENGCAGVGLASCRQLLAHFGGSLHLHSRPDRGATAVVSLPAAEAPV